MARPKPKESQKDDPLFPKTSDILQPLRLAPDELADLRAFLGTLTEPPTRVLFPPVPSATGEDLPSSEAEKDGVELK